VQAELRSAGWGVLAVWECDLRDEPGLITRLTDFLGPPRRFRRLNSFEAGDPFYERT
jgi:hypothetical protein